MNTQVSQIKKQGSVIAVNKMISCESHAINLEASGHNFTNKHLPSNQKLSPKKAKSGAYYMDCLNCGRSVFEDGTGSANGGCYK